MSFVLASVAAAIAIGLAWRVVKLESRLEKEISAATKRQCANEAQCAKRDEAVNRKTGNLNKKLDKLNNNLAIAYETQNEIKNNVAWIKRHLNGENELY